MVAYLRSRCLVLLMSVWQLYLYCRMLAFVVGTLAHSREERHYPSHVDIHFSPSESRSEP